MHWTASEIAELYDRRLAWIRAGGTPRDPRDGPPFAGQFFRTHLLTVLGRTTFDPPRPSNIIGVMSRYDDADLHEEVSDFYVMAGGGDTLVDRRHPGGARDTGGRGTVRPDHGSERCVARLSVLDTHPAPAKFEPADRWAAPAKFEPADRS